MVNVSSYGALIRVVFKGNIFSFLRSSVGMYMVPGVQEVVHSRVWDLVDHYIWMYLKILSMLGLNSPAILARCQCRQRCGCLVVACWG